MIIFAERELTELVVLRGHRCTDKTVLRFSYGDDSLPTNPPYSTRQLQEELGDIVANQSPMPAGGAHGGYALFSSPGQWLITVTEGSTAFGVVRVDVFKARRNPAVLNRSIHHNS
jgi:hypothetical protein